MKRTSFVILFIFFASAVSSQTVAGESTLKAAFIYNFTKYIEWKSEDMQTDFIIGVIGSSPVTTPLTEISKTNKAKNRKIIIRYYEKPEDIDSCNILFIPRSRSFTLGSILEHASKGMLTISEEPGSAKEGTALNFITVGNKLKFEANLDVINAASLSASSQLLKLAIIVGK